MAKKTGKSNLGPEMAKRAYEAKLSERVPYDPDWDGKPMRQKETFDNTKVRTVRPKTRTVGGIGGAGASAVNPTYRMGQGGIAGLALGAIAAYKAELKAVSEAKKKKNRMN